MPDAFFLSKQTNRNLKHPLRQNIFPTVKARVVACAGQWKKVPSTPPNPTLWTFHLPSSSLPLPHRSSRLRRGRGTEKCHSC